MTQTLLITGATSGIGRHAALYLARRGHTVIATGRREHALESLQQEAKGLALHTLRLDVTDEASIAGAVSVVDGLTQGRGVDVLINNAGYGQGGAVLDVSDAELRRQYDTNVFGLLAVSRAFAPAMIRRASGKIINVSSVGGTITFPMMGVYNSTKYAVESLSDALRMELAPLGVQVVVVEPGSIRTEFADTMLDTVQAERTGPWAAVYGHVDRVAKGFEGFSSGPVVISRVFERIVDSAAPRARYLAPFREGLFIGLLNRLPTFARDAALRWAFGLGDVDRSALPAHAAVAA